MGESLMKCVSIQSCQIVCTFQCGICRRIGYDAEGTARYCSMRAARDNSSFKMDATGSDKSYPFFHEGKTDLLIVTEAPIDLMSHASIAADFYGRDWMQDHRISTGCLWNGAIDRYLEGHPQIKRLVFAVDNDYLARDKNGQLRNWGQLTAAKWMKAYTEKGYACAVHVPHLNDFNTDLVEMRKGRSVEDLDRQRIGLKWSAFDFNHNCFSIRHTVTTCNVKGERVTIKKDKAKNKSSLRTYPLIPFLKERLLEAKKQQEENRKLCGRAYNKEYLGYVCVDVIGNLIKPNYVSSTFGKLLAKNNLRHIRFHDLRHTCASLLLANGVPMEQVKEWLGHSEISTTVDIYGHLQYATKKQSAAAIEQDIVAPMLQNLSAVSP